MCAHDSRFLKNRINEEDVSETFCLACVPEGDLTAKGRRELRRLHNLIVNERQASKGAPDARR
jgi:hypothetical protein